MKSRAGLALRACECARDRPLVILCADEVAAESLSATLGSLFNDRQIIHVPSSDQLPGDTSPASPANIGKRLSALRQLRTARVSNEGAGTIVVASGEAAARRYPPPSVFDDRPPLLAIGDVFDPDAFRELAAQIGYVEDELVDEPGEICVRGSVIDIFPADAGAPVRIEFEDGIITSLAHYDPLTQLTCDDIQSIGVAQAVEPVCKRSATLLDHVETGLILIEPEAEKRRKRFLALVREAGDAADGEPMQESVADAAWVAACDGWIQVPADDDTVEDTPRFVEQKNPTRALKKYIAERASQKSQTVIMGSARDLRFIAMRLQRDTDFDLCTLGSIAEVTDLGPAQVGLLHGPLAGGAANAQIALVSAADILGSRAEIEVGTDSASTVENGALDFLSVETGDIVIHEDHGVARLLGLVEDPTSAGGELIALEFASEGRRLVSPADAGRIWRYGSDADAVALDTLNGSSWERRKSGVLAAIAATATELVALAEARASLEAPSIVPDPADYERFAATFPYSETADQARAIQAVRADLASGRPMERLVIGDVGFGKTEVAVRAAAMAALAGFQVMVAAPTTVLARQHLREFERRFAKTGVSVVGLFGSTPASHKKAIAADIATGKAQIVVGTAAVAGKSLRYAKLGLVIIDEEQRFGAADKARLRGRPETHLLVMSATPIPRTLHRSLVGLQAMSVIATPPARRQPIRTALKSAFDNGVATALTREKLRRSQSFVVVPRIADLDEVEAILQRLVPDQSIIKVHGKLPGAQLDQAMIDFAEGKGDVLLATNIIETGLDVPRANTMVVWNADRFGLAQLHQLRGRVGRGRRRGTIILLSPGDSLTERSRKRLETLARHGQLGAGFAIAASDLDQRGGGDLISDAQSGHMKLIGLEYYQHLLEGAISASRGEPVPPPEPEIRLDCPGSIPNAWIPDDAVRLNLYLRLSRIESSDEIEAFREELTDRFAELPPEAEALLAARELAVCARRRSVATLTLGPGGCAITVGKGAEGLDRAGFVRKDERWIRKPEGREALATSDIVAALEDGEGSAQVDEPLVTG